MKVHNNFDPQEFWDIKHSINYPGLFKPTELAIKALPLFTKNPGSAILEIGCGRSGDALFFSKQGFRVIAIDISRVALKELRDNGLGVGKIFFVQSDVSHGLPFRDSSFDAVYSRLSLHYFQDAATKKIFDDIRRVLRISGIFVMSVKSLEVNQEEQEFQKEAEINQHPRHFFTADYAQSLVVNFCQSHVASSSIVSGNNRERKTIEVFAIK